MLLDKRVHVPAKCDAERIVISENKGELIVMCGRVILQGLHDERKVIDRLILDSGLRSSHNREGSHQGEQNNGYSYHKQIVFIHYMYLIDRCVSMT